jgi:hypothetical protein
LPPPSFVDPSALVNRSGVTAKRRGTSWRADRRRGDIEEEFRMLLTIAIIVLILWALGFIGAAVKQSRLV